MNIIILILALFLIIFEAISEGFALAGHKTIAGIFEFIYLSGITLGLFAWLTGIKRFDYKGRFIKIIGDYILLRFALFDIIHNTCAGLPIFFIGSTKWYDIAWNWFFTWSGIDHIHFLFMFKLIALLIGTVWLTNYKQ